MDVSFGNALYSLWTRVERIANVKAEVIPEAAVELLVDAERQFDSLDWNASTLPESILTELLTSVHVLRGLQRRIQRNLRFGRRGRVEPNTEELQAKNIVRRIHGYCVERVHLNPTSANNTVRKRKPRKRQIVRDSTPLTTRQVEVVQIVGECKGNIAEAARRLGRDRKTIKETFDTAMSKLGRSTAKGKTQRLSTDRRGQSNIAEEDDRRG